MVATLAALLLAATPFQVERTGTGPAMVLIPGLSSSGEVWKETAKHFSPRYTCHVVSIAGFGGVPAADVNEPFLATVRDELARYIREQKLERPVLVGHSLGAFLAYQLAAKYPDLVGPVIAVDGVPFLPALMDPAATVASTRPTAAALRVKMASLTAAAYGAQTRQSLGWMVTSPGDAYHLGEMSARSNPKVVGAAMEEVLTTDLRPQVGNIRSPLLLIAAGGAAPNDQARAQLRAAYEAQVHSVPRHQVELFATSRHFVMFDARNALHASMEQFLAKP